MKKISLDQADYYFSLYIRTRDGWTCQRCGTYYPEGKKTGKTKSLHCSHFYSRRNEATRFEPLNCDALCYGCHAFFTREREEYRNWKLKQLGQDQFDQLTLQKNMYYKKDRNLEIIKAQALLKNLQN